jgi:Tfp pilus assembly PilM family ATPase
MTRAVGLDLAPSRATILHLEHSGRETRILQVVELPLPSDGADPVPLLRQALDAAKLPRGRIVAAMDSGEAILREILLPFKNEEQIRKTVRYELESLIHNYAVEDLLVAYTKTGETDKGTQLIAAAVPKEAAARRLKLLQAAGADPVALDLDIAAVFSACIQTGAVDTDEPHLLVYGTSKYAKLVLIEQRRPRSIRTLRFSLEGLPGAPPEDASPAAPEPVVVLADSPADAGEDRLSLLSREISRFLLAQAATATPSHILLAGDIASEEHARRLSRSAGIPVREVDLWSAVAAAPGAVPPGAKPVIAAALGLALKGAGVDPLGMDFRQEEFGYAKKFDAVKNSALVGLQLLVVLLAAVGLHFYFKAKDLRRDAGTVLEHQRSLYETVSGETLPGAEGAFDRMRALFRQAQESQGADLPLKASAREAWRDLAGALLKFQQKYGDRTLGDGRLYLEIDSVDVQQNTMQGNESLTLTVRGRIRNLEFAGLLKQELRAVELFSGADYVGTLSPLPEGELYQFTLRAVKGGRQG